MGNTINGEQEDDLVISTIVFPDVNDYFVFGAHAWDNNGLSNSGLVRIISP